MEADLLKKVQSVSAMLSPVDGEMVFGPINFVMAPPKVPHASVRGVSSSNKTSQFQTEDSVSHSVTIVYGNCYPEIKISSTLQDHDQTSNK